MQPGTRLNHYEVLSPLGEGGMGRVYLAQDTRLKRQVAIKVLPPEVADDPERLARLRREAQVLAQLDHPNVAGVFGLEECDVDGRVERFLVMQLAEGETLADRLTAGPLEPADALDVANQVALGLEAAHAQGIVHRDLKPANLMLGSAGEVKILDFGLARAFGPPDGSTSHFSPDLTASPTVMAATAAGVIMGTAPYMSPEQARGKPVDQRTDLWALGCVLYEMLTGHLAFGGETATDAIASVLQREPDWEELPAGTPRSLRRLLARCLAKDPANRLRDAGDAALMLREGLRAEAGDETEEARTASRGRAARLVPWTVAATGVLLALAALALRPAEPDTGPLKLSATLPDGIGVPVAIYGNNQSVAGIALSPDASMLAFVGADNTEGNLYLRSLGEFAADKLPGTGSATSPFFSPRGDQLGFAAGDRLLRIDLPGGAPIEITRLAAMSPGASWGADDTIVFANGWADGLWVVPATGGSARSLTTLDRDAGEASHRWPHFLPDGRSILFVVKTTTMDSFDDARLAVADLRTGEYQILDAVGTRPSYVDSGQIVFARGGALYAAPFDVKTYETGAPVPVLQGVATATGVGNAFYSATRSGKLAYVAGDVGLPTSQVQRLAPGAAPEPLGFPTDALVVDDISRDGRRLLLSTGGANQSIVVGDMGTRSFTRLDTGPGNNIGSGWSPDDRWVIFSSDLQDGHRLYRVPADGSEPPQRLIPGDTVQLAGRISRDARLLAYTSWNDETGYDAYLLPITADGAADGEPRPVATSGDNEQAGAPSPDGILVAYVLGEAGTNAVLVLNLDSGDRIRLTRETSYAPAWSPDGQYLFFWSVGSLYKRQLLDAALLRFGEPTLVADQAYGWGYVVEADGRSVLTALPSGENLRATEIRIDLGWDLQLRQPR